MAGNFFLLHIRESTRMLIIESIKKLVRPVLDFQKLTGAVANTSFGGRVGEFAASSFLISLESPGGSAYLSGALGALLTSIISY